MDLGIEGRTALVAASSAGLGLACATALAREGCTVTINGRDPQRLAKAQAGIEAAIGKRVHTVVADINTEEGRAAFVAACPSADILVNNNAGPPPGKLADWDHAAWIAAIEANMLAPILLIRALLPGMRARKFGRMVNITSAMVKSPRPHMALSTTARTGLTAFAKAMAIESAQDNVAINNLLPERIDTGRQRFMAERMMRDKGIDMAEARRQIVQSVAARRFGTPAEFGDACAYLCSAQAGFISGQNLQLDGGSYPGLI
ncbi:MAG: 3-oxoacyl-ACP reductase [Candidatus Handelsmanbacteria bacterium RIFCSPLOWO2_12_FULL_64_10]|uniref:3-oxoacyl-ACP reductase n=1 Tax=Handelsmanbacteria sp. (strain RIFCSPLOWO2_12_FULL_64_10) TaxID=1817868 RepID=A0A1F6CTV0_HANXR|nr:MAG: 3-oxoacyl-ACP reductase [Candidatus Handelsmanbacteria bacterium RIFCSPLOWO2_12_FULL_64_10]